MSKATTLICPIKAGEPIGLQALDELIETLQQAKKMLQANEDTEALLFSDIDAGVIGVTISQVSPTDNPVSIDQVFDSETRKTIRWVAIHCVRATCSVKDGCQLVDHPQEGSDNTPPVSAT